MAGFTTTYGNLVLEYLFRNGAAPTRSGVSNVWVGYSKTAGVEVTSTEVNNGSNGQIRQPITFGAFSSKATENTEEIIFGMAKIPHSVNECALFTAAVGGVRMTDWKPVNGGSPIALLAEEQFKMAVGAYDLAST